MKIIEPSYKIETNLDGEAILKNLELAARTCYKSEDKIKQGSAARLIKSIIRRGHLSVIEHEGFTVRFICDRGISHELVRHRLASYSQESTRYCDYSSEVTFIRPFFWNIESYKFDLWLAAMGHAERAYEKLLTEGATPQEARSVLPNSVKTEIVMTANLREWIHVFNMRCAKAAHLQMRQLMLPLLREVHEKIPIIYDKLAEQYLS